NYFLLLSQGGVLYNDLLGVSATGNSWLHTSMMGRTASDFVRVNGSAGHPDFSAAGSAIEFGYLGKFSGAGFFESDTGIDNLSINVNAVPEPSTLLLASLAALGLAAVAIFSGPRVCRRVADRAGIK